MIKITFIGAGSVGFTRRLAHDVLQVPELRDTAFSLHDINEHNLSMVAQILKKDVEANGLPARIETSLDRREALEGADYVINCTRIGGLEAFESDIDVPLQYGVDQCVGDTLCAGGLMYAQRNVPQLLAFSKDALEVGNSSRTGGVKLLNYANPMAMNTWAALDAFDAGEGVDTIGLCHGVEHGWEQIAEALAKLHGDDGLLEDGKDSKWGHEGPHRKLVDVDCVGINHQTWFTRVLYRGREVGPEELLEAFLAHPTLPTTEKVRVDVLKRFGCYSTESNGHLSEYLPWYRKRPDEIRDWIDLKSWINGETGGYLRVCKEGRNWFETDFPRWLDEAGKPREEWGRSTEHGSHVIEALETGRPYRGHFNVRNRGVVTNLPADCVVEAPGYVDRTGVHVSAGHTLNLACAATCNASVSVQRMGKEAAVRGDVRLLKQAMLHDPLVAAVCNPEEVWQMTDHLLATQREWLPQYAEADLDAAAERMKHPTVETRDWEGAARVEAQTVEQLRASGAGDVMDADKGKLRDKPAQKAAKAEA